MGSNYDMITRTRFEAKEVSRSEFEALKRFGDYGELSDGTLMRMEGDKEFRIYCEDSGWLILGSDGPGVIVTQGFADALAAANEDMMKDPELQKDPKGYFDRLDKEHEDLCAAPRAFFATVSWCQAMFDP
jgi:hypothetical protein